MSVWRYYPGRAGLDCTVNEWWRLGQSSGASLSLGDVHLSLGETAWTIHIAILARCIIARLSPLAVSIVVSQAR